MSCPRVKNRAKDEEGTAKYGLPPWQLKRQYPSHNIEQCNIVIKDFRQIATATSTTAAGSKNAQNWRSAHACKWPFAVAPNPERPVLWLLSEHKIRLSPYFFIITGVCDCGKVYIGETRRCMDERTKEHVRDIRLSRTQTLAVSEHANKTGHYPLSDDVKFIDQDPHWYSRRFKEAIHIRLHPININGTGELRFLKRGWLRSDSIASDRYHNGPLREQFHPLTMPKMIWIETHQPRRRGLDTPITSNHGGINSSTQ